MAGGRYHEKSRNGHISAMVGLIDTKFGMVTHIYRLNLTHKNFAVFNVGWLEFNGAFNTNTIFSVFMSLKEITTMQCYLNF